MAAMSMVAFVPASARAHDTWVEAGALQVRTGEYVYVDLRLGNHGNNHRDFKLASKITLKPCELSIIGPDGISQDVKSKLIDTGNAEKEGYWTTRFVAKTSGVYEVVHKLDTLHGKTRAIKSGKTYFVAQGTGSTATGGPVTDRLPDGFAAHGLGLELVLETPLDQLSAGTPIRLRLMRSGKPLGQTLVSFVPRGMTLSDGVDANYERTTDADGRVEFTPREGNLILAVAHHVVEDEKGEGYDRTHYGATLVLAVPQQKLSKP
ncbi:MAG: DUF4198 domain-containing protein [Pirellulaceae bacterium]|nr:DUF4198 domain-containing protein [Pirellulaceae bacterium]